MRDERIDCSGRMSGCVRELPEIKIRGLQDVVQTEPQAQLDVVRVCARQASKCNVHPLDRVCTFQ